MEMWIAGVVREGDLEEETGKCLQRNDGRYSYVIGSRTMVGKSGGLLLVVRSSNRAPKL